MADLEQAIRDEPAGARLDAMCAVAMGRPATNRTALKDMKLDKSGWVAWRVSRDWSAAGPALEWLNENFLTRTASIGPVVCGRNGKEVNMGVWWLEICDKIYVKARTYQHCIARAVALVGLRERPDEMRVAWEALEGE